MMGSRDPERPGLAPCEEKPPPRRMVGEHCFHQKRQLEQGPDV